MLSLLMAQKLNNQARIRDLRARATPGFRKVFDFVPTLLHLNHPDLPGYLDVPFAPRGVLFYDTWLKNVHESERPPFVSSPPDPPRPVVESLALIGSSGSVGHTAGSDLDYWVCYRPSSLPPREMELFSQKLAAITQWALQEHGAEANFYLVNLSELEKGQVSRNWGADKTEGEVAPQFLLEELYRTCVFVAGRVPLWTIWPLEGSQEDYLKLARQIAPLEWRDAPPRFVNMGFPEKPNPQEFLAASMWLAYKSESAPFKGILKIVPILEALEENFAAPLLCDIVKREIIRNPDPNSAVDPYIITVESVIKFAEKKFTPDNLNLLRESSILKVLGLTGKSPAAAPADDPAKKRVIDRWISEWNWPREKLDRLLDYDNWSDRERLDQGNALLVLLFSVYIAISNRLITLFPDQVNAQDAELAPFAARILGRQKGLEATVDLLPSQFHRASLSKGLALDYDRQSQLWSVYNYAWEPPADLPSATLPQEAWKTEKNRVYEAKRAVKAAAWLARNQLLGHGFNVSVPENSDSLVTDDYFNCFLYVLNSALPPLSFSELNPDTLWQAAAQGTVLLAFNFEIPRETSKILTLDAVFRTGWGEMRHVWTDASDLRVEADKYLLLSSFLLESCGVFDPQKLRLGDPNPSNHLRRAFLNLKSAFAASLYKSPNANRGESRALIDL
jgi:adenylate cyclase class 1